MDEFGDFRSLHSAVSECASAFRYIIWKLREYLFWQQTNVQHHATISDENFKIKKIDMHAEQT